MQNDFAREKDVHMENVNNIRETHAEEITMIQTTVSTIPLVSCSSTELQEVEPDGPGL